MKNWHTKLMEEIEEYEKQGKCFSCKGTGFVDSYKTDTGEERVCLTCGGTGKFKK